MLNAGDSDAADYRLNRSSCPLPTGHMAALYFSASLAVRCGRVTELSNEVGAEVMCALPGHFSKGVCSLQLHSLPHQPQGVTEPERAWPEGHCAEKPPLRGPPSLNCYVGTKSTCPSFKTLYILVYFYYCGNNNTSKEHARCGLCHSRAFWLVIRWRLRSLRRGVQSVRATPEGPGPGCQSAVSIASPHLENGEIPF